MSDITTLRTNVRTTYLKIDPNAKVWDNNTLDYFINRWYDKVQEDFQYDMPECEESTTITTVGGTVEYNKPLDFVRIWGLFYNTLELWSMTKKQTLRFTSSQTIPSNYYIYWSKIGLYPTPDWVYVLDMLYNKKLPEITDLVDSVLPKDMEDIVILYTVYLMLVSVEKQVKANMCLGQYESKKNWLYEKNMYNDDSINFGTARGNSRPRQDAIY